MKTRFTLSLIAGGLLAHCTAATFAQQTPPPPPPAQPPAVAPAPAGTQPASTQPIEESKARIEMEPTDFSFGELWQGEPCERKFKIKNVGTEPLTLDVSTSCGCTVATKPKSPVDPGETTEFSATYSTSHAGQANKKITVRTNDPTKPAVEIEVKGTVKALFLATPSEIISFQNLDAGDAETLTIKLENKYTEPLKLKLKEGQEFDKFGIELKELKEGHEYELTAKTRPPLNMGFNRTQAIVETGFDKVPTVTYQVTANVQPRVLASPPQLFVTAAASQPMQQMVRVQYRASNPLKITEVKATPDTIKTEILPPAEPVAGSKVAFLQLAVTLPAFNDLPDKSEIQILTDDPSPEYQKLVVPVSKRVGPARQITPIGPRPASAAPNPPGPGQPVQITPAPPGAAPPPAPVTAPPPPPAPAEKPAEPAKK